jgi:hypothetical protein
MPVSAETSDADEPPVQGADDDEHERDGVDDLHDCLISSAPFDCKAKNIS